MTATEQLRQALREHEERCEICQFSQCAVAAGIAYDLRRAMDEEKRQETIAFPVESGYAALRRRRIELALARRQDQRKVTE